jgi:hypothetical protein
VTRLPRIASTVYAAGVAAFAAFGVWFSVTEHVRQVFGDDWVILSQRGEQSFGRWLISSHNGHLIPLTRLLFHVDLEWLSARGDLPTAVGLAATAAAAVLLWLPVRSSGIEPMPVRRMVGAFLVFGLVWGGLCYGLLWGFSAHAPVMMAWLALAAASLIAYAQEDPARRRGQLLALAFTGAFGASVACASGVGAWASLLVVALAARLPARVVGAIAAGGALCALLVASAPLPEGSRAVSLPLTPFLSNPVVMLRFAFRYLGTPFAWPAETWLGASEAASTRVAFAAGAIGLSGGLAHIAVRLRAGRVADAASLLALALMVSGIASAALTAAARAGNFQAVTLRFTPFALLFWMGAAVALAAPGPARWRGPVGRALPLLLPLASLALALALGPTLDQHLDRNQKIARHALMLVVGLRNDALYRVFANSRHTDFVKAGLPALEARGRGPFGDPRRRLLGAPLAAAGIGADPPACAGKIADRSRIGGRHGGEAIEGELRADTGQPLPVSIVVADAAGTIRGLGDVLPAERGIARWYAYRASLPRRSERIYGVFAGGGACVLARRQ